MEEVQRRAAVYGLWPLLVVRDIEQSLDFYCDRLGFELIDEALQGETRFWCRLTRGSVSLMLQQSEAEDGPAEGRGRGVSLYLLCDDVDRIHSEFQDRGLTLPAPELAYYGMKQLFVPDPDGYSVCFESAAE
jgi:glyoxylase I family protein